MEARWRWYESVCSRSLGSEAGSFSGQTRLCLSVMGRCGKGARSSGAGDGKLNPDYQLGNRTDHAH